jgi:hypothetical protein
MAHTVGQRKMKYAISLRGYFHDKRDASQKVFVRVIFGAFFGSLVLLLILLYAGAPIV